MAVVVLLWNEHPTEVVAGFHARKVAKILEERYGHYVEVMKIPFGASSYAELRLPGKTLRQKLLILANRFGETRSITEHVARKIGIAVFNFHSSDARVMAQARKRKPHEFRISRKYTRKPRGELEVIKRGKNAFLVETPAHFYSLPSRAFRINVRELLKEVGRVSKKLSKAKRINLVHALDPYYQCKVARLQSTHQRKYISPIISEKLADEIHARLIR